MDSPFLELLEPSKGKSSAIVLITGYISEGDFDEKAGKKWSQALRQAGWNGSIYHLWWESGGDKLKRVLRGPIGWEQIKSKAKRVGKDYLSVLVSTIPEKSISLIGYSLGVRIIYYGMESWDSYKKVLKDAVLLGGAVPRDKAWGSKTSSLTGRIINVFNFKDEILSVGYNIVELGRSSPCGLKPIKDQHYKIINVDATSLIGTPKHLDKHYLRVLRETAGRQLWR